MLPLVLSFVLLGGVSGLVNEDWRSVELEGLGEVQGMKYWDGDFHEFYGVPFATAPTGPNKYKAPLPPTPWDEPLKANRLLTVCQQVYYSSEQDGEDFLAGEHECLVAHLMVPIVGTSTNLVPVVVYIHSGAYVGGSGSMAKFHKMAQQDVLVVTLNYRLGALGFACLGTEDIPGNAALKDIVAGLKWVNKHIKSFGGDPKRVTLAGFSVGATLAELLALTKETDGLFQKLMLDSGSALQPYAVDRDPINTARNIAKSIGFVDSGTIQDLNDFLLEAPLLPLLANSRNYFLKNSTFGFAPCLENSQQPGALLTESPYEILKKGDYGEFEVFTGFGNLEGISRTSQFEDWMDLMNDDFGDFLPVDLIFTNNKEKWAFIKEIMKKYFKGDEVSHDTLKGYVEYFGDAMFKHGIMRSAKLHAEKRPIYLYEFSYYGKLNTKHQYLDKIQGGSHRDASAYVLDFYDWTRNYTDMDMRDRMVAMWSDYVIYGNPTAYESKLIKTNWEKYTNKEPKYMDIGYDLVMKTGLYEDNYKFWDKVYSKNYWNPSPPNPGTYKPTVKITKPIENVKLAEPPKMDEDSKTEKNTKEKPQVEPVVTPKSDGKKSANEKTK